MTGSSDALPEDIETAVHTAVSEIPDAHPDDIADCVCGMLSWDTFEAYEPQILKRIRQYL